MKQDNKDNSKAWQITNTGGTNYSGEIHFHGSEPNSQLTQQEYRNRKALLNKVKNFWVKGVLEKSLYNQVLIELGLEERLDAVANLWQVDIETGDSSPQPLPQGTKVIDIFDQSGAGRTLLILGKPGTGKTTTLLELTRDLITRAEENVNHHLIPVIFNLSSWAVKRHRITDWLVEELNTKYQVPKKIGQPWLEQQQLLPLLDGLDEVKAEYREQCLDALNAFHQEYGSELVVCSRIKDYNALSNRLNFQRAVYIRSLTLEQASQYLDSVGSNFTGLKALIEKDTVLQELANSPLMLNIMTLAYQGVAVENLPKVEVMEKPCHQLFDDYIKQIFNDYIKQILHRHNRSRGGEYSEYETKCYLVWLAQRMVKESQTVFYIEGMQPTWLQTNGKRILYRIGSLSIWGKAEIKTVETLQWSGKEVKKRLVRGLIPGLIVWLIFGLFFVMIEQSISGMFPGLICGLMAWLIFGLFPAMVDGLKGSAIEEKTIPNQGIYRTAMNAGIIALIIGLISWPISGLFSELPSGLDGLGYRLTTGNGLIEAQGAGVFFGLMALIFGGGKTCIQHFILRLILCWDGYIPWNYARFLDYATEHIFLQKVGGGYIFMHRLLLEHFAEMELEVERKSS